MKRVIGYSFTTNANGRKGGAQIISRSRYSALSWGSGVECRPVQPTKAEEFYQIL
jgi:hypothetical protein